MTCINLPVDAVDSKGACIPVKPLPQLWRPPAETLQLLPLGAPQQLLQPRPATGVEDVLGLEPTAARLIDAETHQVQVGDAVGDGRDHELEAELLPSGSARR